MTRLRYVGTLSYELRADGKAFPVSPGVEFVVSDFAAAAVIKRGTPVEIVLAGGDRPAPAAATVNEVELSEAEAMANDEDAEPAVGDDPMPEAAPALDGVTEEPSPAPRPARCRRGG